MAFKGLEVYVLTDKIKQSRARSKSERITVRFKENEIKIIDNLVEKIGAKDRSELIRSAVTQLNEKYNSNDTDSEKEIPLNEKLSKKYK